MRKELEAEQQKTKEEKERMRVSGHQHHSGNVELQRQVQKESEVAAMRKQYKCDLQNIQVSVNNRCPDVPFAESIP